MIVIDANLLIYAYNEASEHHRLARKWLERTLGGRDPVRLPWSSIHAFLRIMTQPSLFQPAFTMQRAATLVDEWLGQPHITVIEPGPRYWAIFRQLLPKAQIRGNLVMDAHLAALTIEHAGTLYTTDKDFSRFDDLRVVNPIARA